MSKTLRDFSMIRSLQGQLKRIQKLSIVQMLSESTNETETVLKK